MLIKEIIFIKLNYKFNKFLKHFSKKNIIFKTFIFKG